MLAKSFVVVASLLFVAVGCSAEMETPEAPASDNAVHVEPSTSALPQNMRAPSGGGDAECFGCDHGKQTCCRNGNCWEESC